MEFKDKNNQDVYVGAIVDVPSPNKEDSWDFEFTGTIIALDKEEGYVTVEDGDGKWWIIEVERVELS